MPTVLAGLDRLPDDQPRSVVSPLHELGAALHVLATPDHHGAEAWAAGVQARLGADLLAETRAWEWTASGIRARVFLLVPAGDRLTIEPDDALGRLAEDDAAGLAADLLRPLTSPGTTRSVRDWAAARGPAVTDTVGMLLDDPVAGGQRFAAFVERSWEAWFADEWSRVRPALVASARRFQDVRERAGAANALASLGPAFTARPDDAAVEITKVQNRRHDVATRGLAVAPSAFVGPHVYVADVPGQPLLVQHPLDPPEAAPTAAQVRRRLDALANPARLEVARAIAGEPRTAPEVAGLWRMDPTAVTRHLRALAAVGLATTERRGRYVRYRLDHGALRSLGDDLLELLLR